VFDSKNIPFCVCLSDNLVGYYNSGGCSRKGVIKLLFSASHMELQDPGTTCGPLLLSKKVATARVHMCPLRVPHHMLGMTTSVKQAMTTTYMVSLLGGILMTHSGMAKTVEELVPVSVPSTVPPGSASNYPRPQLTILKFVFAHFRRQTFHWKILKSTFIDDLYTHGCEQCTD